jgi:hypothetical protein
MSELICVNKRRQTVIPKDSHERYDSELSNESLRSTQLPYRSKAAYTNQRLLDSRLYQQSSGEIRSNHQQSVRAHA